MKRISFFIICVLLTGCSSDLVQKRYHPDFQTTIMNSNKSVLVIEPSVISYKLADEKKENYEASKYLTTVVKDATIVSLSKKGYMPIIGDANSSYDVTLLKNEIAKKINFYIQKTHINIGSVSANEAMKLDDNFGDTAVKLGQIFNTDLILGLQYQSSFKFNNSPGAFNGLLFQAIDSVAKSGITKKEVYLCFLVLIDAKTGNVIYSNAVYDERKPILSISENDLFKPDYKDQVITIIDTTLP